VKKELPGRKGTAVFYYARAEGLFSEGSEEKQKP